MVGEKKTQNEEEIIVEDELDENYPEEDTEEENTLKEGKIKELRNQLRKAIEDKKQLQEDLSRGRADFLNSKRRLEEQFLRDKERSTDKILLELLTIIDSFNTAKADIDSWNAIDARWRDGVDAIYTKLLSILKNSNVEMIHPIHKKFDPREHEAVSSVTVKDDAIDTVIEVLQDGFKRNETVIRPARVVVGTK